jgi:DNA-binding transcriptional LysR family regulator
MELHQLRYVLKVAKHLHFTNAASDLGITQPSLSQQIDKLEKELGVKLFERKTRSVELTLAGEDFIMHANRVFAELDQLGEAMQKHSISIKRNIRIGTLSNIGRLELSRQLRLFQSIHPTTNIHVVEKSGSYELVKMLRVGTIDAAVLFPSPDISLDTTIICQPLIHGRVNVITREDHPFANRETVLLPELAHEDCIFPSRTHSMYNALLTACKANGFNPKIVSECNQVDTILDLIIQGFGVSFVSSQLADSISFPSVAIIPLEPAIERDVSFVYLSKMAHSSLLKVFRDFIVKAFNQSG